MTYKDAMPILKDLPQKYNFTSEEKEAFANVIYICKKKAEEETFTPACLYYVGEYFFHDWKNAVKACKFMKEKYIIEKRTDKSGQMTAKKYTITPKGEILSVRKL